MKYPRPKFLEEGVKTLTVRNQYGGAELVLPIFDTPITPKENFIRAAKRDNPLWVPNHLSDTQDFQINQLGKHKLGKYQNGSDFLNPSPVDYIYIDPYGASWTWVASVQGAMLTPGSTPIIDDITKWEQQVKWPNLDEWTYAEVAEDFMKNHYDPNRALHVNIFQGCTEVLVALMGGYGEGMLAMAMEPEAVRDFFECFADHMIEFYDLMKQLYPPLTYVTYHDDWGTERETFFSPAMMEDLVFEPTKRIVQHVKDDGVFFELHSCGKIERFLPYMIDMGIDFLQIQRRAVDIPKMKELYGDKIGFNPMLEDYNAGEHYTNDEIIAIVRKTVDLYAKGGGFYPWVFESDPEAVWTLCTELYAYSREYYDRSQK